MNFPFTWSREPALYVAAANAVLILGIAFGLPVTPDQKVAIDGVLAAALALTAGVVIRGQVTPV